MSHCSALLPSLQRFLRRSQLNEDASPCPKRPLRRLRHCPQLINFNLKLACIELGAYGLRRHRTTQISRPDLFPFETDTMIDCSQISATFLSAYTCF